MKMLTNKPAALILGLGLLLGLSLGKIRQQNRQIRLLQQQPIAIADGRNPEAVAPLPDMEQFDAELERQTEALLREIAELKQAHQEMLRQREGLVEARIHYMRRHRME